MNNTYESYMQELREALSDFDPAFSAEILEDFEAHFAAGTDNGMTQEEICSKLGPVADVIEELKDDFRASSPNVPKVTGRRPGEKHTEEPPVTEIQIRLINASVQLASGDVPDVVCDYDRDDFSERFVMYTENCTLYLQETPLSFLRRFGSSRSGGTFLFTVPPSVRKISVSNTNSRICILGLCADTVSLNTTNGALLLEDLSVRNGSLGCVNGKIRLERCRADALEASSTNGPIQIAGNIRALTLSSTNGSVRFAGAVTDSFSASTVNGSVHTEYEEVPDGASLSLATNWGKISASFQHTRTNSGKRLETSYGGGKLKIKIRTGNGGIHLQEIPAASGAAQG